MIPCTFTEEIIRNLAGEGDRNACSINEIDYTYKEFSEIVGSIQGKILRTGSDTIGVAIQNDVHTYAAIVAIWLTGKTYVPIHTEYPLERIQIILEEAGIKQIFINKNLQTETTDLWNLPECEFIDSSGLSPAEPFNHFPDRNKTAYILFTSGTTGRPKGVPISFGNLQSFLDNFNALGYDLSAEDRFLQMFELTFDLSIMCFAVPLVLGASFHTLPSDMIKTLGLYHTLESKAISFSLMVPSAVHLLKPYLSEIELPELKYSQFCGEALNLETVELWRQCVPNAVIDNVYGPTEATIYCSRYRVTETPLHQHGIISIGTNMKGMKTIVFNNNEEICATGETGELCLSGDQLTAGYLNNPEQNEKAFFTWNGEIFYRSGDLAYTAEDGNIMYCGRKDNQVKIQGYRIELSEIEHAAKNLFPGTVCIAIGYKNEKGIWQLALFVEKPEINESWVQKELSLHLPEYMIPHKVMSIDTVPLNANGKTDRKALQNQLENQQS